MGELYQTHMIKWPLIFGISVLDVIASVEVREARLGRIVSRRDKMPSVHSGL